MIWYLINNEFGRMWNWPWHYVRYYPDVCLEVLSKTMMTPYQDSRFPCWDLNPWPPRQKVVCCPRTNYPISPQRNDGIVYFFGGTLTGKYGTTDLATLAENNFFLCSDPTAVVGRRTRKYRAIFQRRRYKQGERTQFVLGGRVEGIA
jgi:hypothetical protein